MRIYEEIKNLNPSVIVEAGTNIGLDTVRLCDMFPEALVYGLEPIPTLYQHVSSFKKPNLRMFNQALYEYTGTTDFYVDMSHSGLMGASSILPIEEDYKVYVEREEKITVSCITLQRFCHKCKIEMIDLLWLDAEMTEYKILKASEKFLKNIKNIYLEVSYSKFRIGQPTYEEIDLLLITNGFKQVFIEPQGHPELLWQANTLYRHE
jgi:FkbM family methyltransferase